MLVDNPVLMIDAPILDDESAANVYQFLQDLTLAFESQYYNQLKRFNKNNNVDWHDDKQGEQLFFDDDVPF